MSKVSDERKKRRMDRARDDYDNKDKDTGSGFGERPGFFASASKLEKLGVSEYRTSAGEKGEAKTHRIHILPPHPDDPDQIGLKIYAHYEVGADESAHLCPKWMKRYLTKIGMDVPEEIADGQCPVCERHDVVLARYKKTKDSVSEKEREAMWEELRSLVPYSSSYKSPKPKKVLVWVVDGIDEDTMDEGVKFFMMPATAVYEEGVLEVCVDDDDGSMIDILDTSKAGHSFQFRRKGEQLSTKYTSPKLVARKWDVETETDWLDEVPRYTDVLKFSSYDTIAAALGKSTAAAAPPEEEEEDAPRRRRRSAEDDEGEDAPPKRRRKAAPDGEGDDEPPRRRRRSEPEEEDEDDDGSDANAIRDKIKDRRARIAAAKEDGGDDKDDVEDVAGAPPKRRRRSEPAEDEDEPPKRRRRPAKADVDPDDEDIPF